jgi:hypothetical protein
MQESTERESSKENDSAADATETDSEATSKETLSDLEENKRAVEPASGEPGPSPDGALDESDEIKDAGPM